jgi:hypothetical protein
MTASRPTALVLCWLLASASSSAQDARKTARTLPWEGKAPAFTAPTDPAITAFTLPAAYRDCAADGGKPAASRDIAGYAPVEAPVSAREQNDKVAGRHPVFVYLTGTLMRFNGPEAQVLTSEMAKRGFLAAAVDYDNAAYPYCPGMTSKAACIFDADAPRSAIAQICALPQADCTRGIVVAGFSQGANLAALAANRNPNVRAAYLLGHGDRALNGFDVSRCADDAATALAPSQMRSVTGEADLFFGGSQAGVRKQFQRVVGIACAEGLDCATENGGGWHIVASTELRDGGADHCYFLDRANVYCSTYEGLDPSWQHGTQPWALGPSLDWLAAQVTAPRPKVSTSPATVEARGSAPEPISEAQGRSP